MSDLIGYESQRRYSFPRRSPDLLECLNMPSNEEEKMTIDILYSYRYRCGKCNKLWTHSVWNIKTLTLQEANERFKPRCCNE